MDKKLISQIVSILKANEKALSDGYGYYSGSRVNEVLEGIATEIASLLTQHAADELKRCNECGALGYSHRDDCSQYGSYVISTRR